MFRLKGPVRAYNSRNFQNIFESSGKWVTKKLVRIFIENKNKTKLYKSSYYFKIKVKKLTTLI